jgi:23S rRNA pseudouridine2605 synthase
MSSVRLQKYLSDQGVASRREAERWIESGRIKINGKVTKQLGVQIDPESDQILVDDKSLATKMPPKVYWLLNKPDKVLTSRNDQETGKATIYDLPMLKKTKFLISPVGRLDYRTEGLLLMTNDGEMNHRLCRPEYHIEREYQVLSSIKLTAEQLLELRKGLEFKDGPVRNVKIQFVHSEKMGKSSGAWYVVTVHEGRNRLVRRIFEHFDARVIRLLRVGFGDLRLTTELLPGTYRQLTGKEIAALKKQTNLARKTTSERAQS